MSGRTISLLATPAVVGAMTIAVPALAGTGARRAGHAASARGCNAVTVLSHGRRVRACLLRGPRGPRGLPGTTGARGATGSRGPNGKNGTNGKNGAPGAPGTAKAYAVVQPTSPTAANLITGQTSNFTGVGEVKPGTYCLAPAAGINPATDTATVAPEVSYSTGGLAGIVALNAQRTDCSASDFEVQTYAYAIEQPTPPTTTPKLTLTLTSGYAFTIVVA